MYDVNVRNYCNDINHDYKDKEFELKKFHEDRDGIKDADNNRNDEEFDSTKIHKMVMKFMMQIAMAIIKNLIQ